MTTLTVSARQFAELIRPVLPLAGSDLMLPVLNAVLVETNGEWLSATATDRFRAGIKRIKKTPTDDDPATEWPEFSALVPLRAVKSLLTLFKPGRAAPHLTHITLTVEDDKLIAEGSGSFDLFDASRFTYHLQSGEFPAVNSLFRKALETPADQRVTAFGLNPALLADFKACGSPTLRVLTGGVRGDGKPDGIVLMDDEGFIALLMPRGRVAARDEDWTDFLAKKPEPKPAVRKSRTKKAVA